MAGTLFTEDSLARIGAGVTVSAPVLAMVTSGGANLATRRLAAEWMRVDPRERETWARRVLTIVPLAIALILASAATGLVSWRSSVLMTAMALGLVPQMIVAVTIARAHLRKRRPEGFWWIRRYPLHPIKMRRALEELARLKRVSVQDDDRSTGGRGIPFGVSMGGRL